MIPLIGILLSIYLVFKGFEIFQIAFANREARPISVVLGVLAFIASIVIGAIFAFLFLSSSIPTTNSPPLPNF